MIDTQELTKIGAKVKLADLELQVAELRAMVGEEAVELLLTKDPVRARKPLSAAARKKIGQRMRAFWAERRKAEKK